MTKYNYKVFLRSLLQGRILFLGGNIHTLIIKFCGLDVWDKI